MERSMIPTPEVMASMLDPDFLRIASGVHYLKTRWYAEHPEADPNDDEEWEFIVAEAKRREFEPEHLVWGEAPSRGITLGDA
jgi:hypothetical protein